MVSGALPAHPASFIGRERQLADLGRLLESSRLVTLTGPGGTGKTRLALRLAELCEFDRPTIFVPLASLTQPDLVPLAIAEAMGVSESPGRSTEDAILAALCRRAALLILDNLEHLLAAGQTRTRTVADLVSDLLAGCPHIKVLATSREALRLTGEQVYPVPPLTLPSGANGHAAESEAVRLFLDRARAASAVLPPESEPDVAEICRRLEGLPLAIELAAARTAVLTPAALLRRLEQRLPLLVGGARDLPARQQTLRGAIAWSYGLLTPAEQALFRRLAVFHGGATLDAIAAVCLNPDRTVLSGDQPVDDLALLELLQSLAAKSMIRIEQDETGEPRFTMFETIREFGLEQLEAPIDGVPTGEAPLIRGRHLAAYLELVRQRLDKRHATAARQWRGRLEREHNNLRSALRWCLETRDAERALALAGALWAFWYSQRHFSEGRAWLTQVLGLAEETLPTEAPHEGRAKALLGAAWLAYKQGDPIAASYAERSLGIYRALGSPQELAAALRWAACAFDDARADALAREALALHESLGDEWGRASALVLLGEHARKRGDYAAARSHYEESLSILEQVGGPERANYCVATANLGYVALRSGDALEAARLFERSLLHDGPYAEIISGLAGCAVALGDPQRAARLLGAIQSYLDARGEVLDSTDHVEFLRDYAATRAALGSGAFDAAYEAGRAMDQSSLRAYALDWQSSLKPSAGSVGNAAAADDTSAEDINEAAARLSKREREVAALLARGYTNRGIAQELVISERTAANHVEHILTKLGFRARTQIAAWAAQHGLK